VDLSPSGRLVASSFEHGDELSLCEILNYLFWSKVGESFLFDMNSMSTLWENCKVPKFRSWKETFELRFSIFLNRAKEGRWKFSESIYRYAICYRLLLFPYVSLTLSNTRICVFHSYLLLGSLGTGVLSPRK
jgi:hypothetical protein